MKTKNLKLGSMIRNLFLFSVVFVAHLDSKILSNIYYASIGSIDFKVSKNYFWHMYLCNTFPSSFKKIQEHGRKHGSINIYAEQNLWKTHCFQRFSRHSRKFFHCLELELYICKIACCMVCFCFLFFVCMFVY